MMGMIPIEAQVLLQLVRAALVQSGKVEFPEECEKEKLVRMIKKHRLLSTVYPVIRNQEGTQWENIADEMKISYSKSVRRTIVQEQEIQSLLEAMEQDGMECIPLKGWIMRECYPDSTLRSMADLDVLVKDYDADRMTKWMADRGYTPWHEGDECHDCFLKKPYMNIEMHRILIPENPAQQAWEKEMWNRCRPEEGKQSIYRMSVEDFYIHHILHMHKHFILGGTGLRSLVDTWLLLQHYQNQMDQKYLDQMLKNLEMTAFSKQMEKLSRICMEGKKADSDQAMILNYMIDSGVYGTVKNEHTMEVMKQKQSGYLAKKGVVKLRVIFPKTDVVKERYPIVGKYPILLPLFWIVRILRVIFCDRSKLHALDYSAVSKEQYHSVQEVLRIVGAGGMEQ